VSTYGGETAPFERQQSEGHDGAFFTWQMSLRSERLERCGWSLEHLASSFSPRSPC
jgi:hypothetical protein